MRHTDIKDERHTQRMSMRIDLGLKFLRMRENQRTSMTNLDLEFV